MIWINKFFLFMSLSGSIALLLYYLSKALWSRYLSASCQYLLLKVCMCFFLLPVPLFSEEIRFRMRIFFPDFTYGMTTIPDTWVHMNLENLIYDTPDGYILPGFSWFAMLALVIWLVTVTVILLIRYKNYRKIRQLTKHTAIPSAQLTTISRNLQKSMRFHRKITAYSLNAKFTPFCYGLFSPRIVVPEEYEKDAELILRHELQHIKSLDFLFRILALLITALHFFNPFAYLLFYEIGKASESACDEKVMRDFSEEQQTRYVNLLLNIAVYSPFQTYSNAFSGNNKKAMKERIFMMKRPRKTKFAVLICSIMCTVFFSTLPAAAYELPQIEETDSYVPVPEGSYLFTTSETPPYEEESDVNEKYFSISDYFFVDEEGNFIDLENDFITPRVLCSHSYVSGYLYNHNPKSNGGCTYTKYSVKRCSKCGAIKDKTLISSSTYTVCPHK